MNLLLLSSSNVYGYGYLDHAEPFIREFLGSGKCVGFIPFAAHDHAAYTRLVRERQAAGLTPHRCRHLLPRRRCRWVVVNLRRRAGSQHLAIWRQEQRERGGENARGVSAAQGVDAQGLPGQNRPGT